MKRFLGVFQIQITDETDNRERFYLFGGSALAANNTLPKAQLKSKGKKNSNTRQRNLTCFVNHNDDKESDLYLDKAAFFCQSRVRLASDSVNDTPHRVHYQNDRGVVVLLCHHNDADRIEFTRDSIAKHAFAYGHFRLLNDLGYISNICY